MVFTKSNFIIVFAIIFFLMFTSPYKNWSYFGIEKGIYNSITFLLTL